MITFVGDVFPKEHVNIEVDLPGTLVINMEAPLTASEKGYPGKINLRGSASALSSTFQNMKVVATLANNHSMDFHEEGLLDTLSALAELNIPFCGVGDESNDWRNPVWLEDGGITVAILAYADISSTPVYARDGQPGAAPLSLDRVVADMSAARADGADRVAVAVHWGEEQVHLPSPRCVELARAFVNAGADVVVGHHAHCIQSYETYAGKPIMYGLGNFIFPRHKGPSYYDTKGKPTRMTDIRPAGRNRRSLALSWEPEDGSFAIKPLYYTGSSVIDGRFGHRRFRLKMGDAAAYEARYSRAYSWGKLLHAFSSFVSNPKAPKPVHLRNALRILRTTTRS